ncbi:MAG: ATPase, partial [Oxalobacteraceae bacterium]
MPQLSQIGAIYASQLFWLLIVFAIIYFGIGRGMVSKIDATMVGRDRKIASDLKAAEAARATANTTGEAYRTRMETARNEALKATAEAKAAAARASEARVKAADAEIDARRLHAGPVRFLGRIGG